MSLFDLIINKVLEYPGISTGFVAMAYVIFDDFQRFYEKKEEERKVDKDYWKQKAFKFAKFFVFGLGVDIIIKKLQGLR